jgi:transposase
MLSFSGALRVFGGIAPCEMRKGFSGLHALTTERLTEDPRGGSLFVFTNRRRHRIKILFRDCTGAWMCSKRLEEDSFSWPQPSHDVTTKLSLTPEALALLTDGSDLRGAKLRPWYQRE